jgi:hypothetical protein
VRGFSTRPPRLQHLHLPVAALAVALVVAGCRAASRTHTTTAAAAPPSTVVDSVDSPDGTHVALVKSDPGSTYTHIEVVSGHARSGKTVYDNEGCCDGLVWASPNLLVFADDYETITVNTLTGNTTTIAHFSNFVVSPSGRWVAGYSYSGHGKQYVFVVSIAGGGCRIVPSKPAEDVQDPYFSANGRLHILKTNQGHGHWLSFDVTKLPHASSC